MVLSTDRVVTTTYCRKDRRRKALAGHPATGPGVPIRCGPAHKLCSNGLFRSGCSACSRSKVSFDLAMLGGENVMIPQTFSTQPLPIFEQFEGWRRWHRPTFEVQSPSPSSDGFLATNSNWSLEGLTVSRVCSPATGLPAEVGHTPQPGRPLGHQLSGQAQRCRGWWHDARGPVAARTPVVLSLGEEIRVSHHDYDDRLQLFLSRDRFGRIAHILEAVKAEMLPTAQGGSWPTYAPAGTQPADPGRLGQSSGFPAPSRPWSRRASRRRPIA